jgi:hypothetical protein
VIAKPVTALKANTLSYVVYRLGKCKGEHEYSKQSILEEVRKHSISQASLALLITSIFYAPSFAHHG